MLEPIHCRKWKLLADYRVSERRACATVLPERTVYRYVGHPRDDRAVRQRIKEIAATRVRYGFERIHLLLTFSRKSLLMGGPKLGTLTHHRIAVFDIQRSTVKAELRIRRMQE